jgi:hypothetical protein
LKIIEKGTQIYTDEFNAYSPLKAMGYKHGVVLHGENIFVLGDAYVYPIECFWSLSRNGFRGTFHAVCNKYLQDYSNEFVFRYNHRNDEKSMFLSFLGRLSLEGAQFS